MIRQDMGDAFGPRSRRSGRAAARLAGFATSIAIALAGCKSEQPTQPHFSPISVRQQEENALAGYMLRLGYDKLIVACAYEVAKEGGSRAEAFDKCLIDFRFTGPISGSHLAIPASGMEARQGGDVKQAPSRSDDSPTGEARDAQTPQPIKEG